jgi:thioredoxin 1
MSNIAQIQDNEIDTLLAKENLIVIDFTATWCGPCRKISPLMDQLAEEYKGKIKVFKLDVDQNKDSAKKYGIRSIPAVLIFKQGTVVETIVGIESYERFSSAVDLHL